MIRRNLLLGLGAAAATGISRVGAQPAVVPVVGFLNGGSPSTFGHVAAAFRRGLAENGFGSGRVAIEERWAEGEVSRLRTLADDLVRSQVTVLAAGGPAAALAAKAATASIPIIFTSGEDPVKLGLVANYAKPGGNVTGIATLVDTLSAKRLGLVRELIPAASQVAAMLDPGEPAFNSQVKDVSDAAGASGLRVHVLRAHTEDEIEAAFVRAKELHVSAMLVGLSFFYSGRRERLARLALSQRLPTIFGHREYALAGGLMSYSTDIADAYFQAGVYAAKILKGMHPADLPVAQSAKFQLVINQRAAKALGITFPSGIVSIADEVIE